MAEIRVVWQLLQRTMPQMMKRPDTLKRYVRILRPQSLKTVRNGTDIEITGDVWIRMPSKRTGRPGKPDVVTQTIVVDGLTLSSSVNIDLAKLKQGADTQELLKGLFLATLLALGIFTNDTKRKAFKKHMKL